MIVDLFVYEDKSSPTTQVWQSFFSEYLPEWDLKLCFVDELFERNPKHLLFPGGSGSAFYKKLGDRSTEVVNWVGNGGSYVGVCAGAYLASNHLKITPLVIPDKAWERGLHDVVIDMNEQDHTVNYHNGPVFIEHSDVEVWARFKSNILAEGGFYNMEGTPAITHNTFCKGRVSLFSPHLEKSSPEIKKELASIFEYIESKNSNK
jgi:glutamine amidotransferase-like uncharacterized protein